VVVLFEANTVEAFGSANGSLLKKDSAVFDSVESEISEEEDTVLDERAIINVGYLLMV
jgi:hypothetical protein